MSALLNPKRTIAELKELRTLTADDNGAQRVAFTKTWVATREWLTKKLERISGGQVFAVEEHGKDFTLKLLEKTLPLEIHTDAAGNLWTTLRGESDRALLI